MASNYCFGGPDMFRALRLSPGCLSAGKSELCEAADAGPELDS